MSKILINTNILKILDERAYTCVAEKDGEIVHKLSGAGVSPLLRLYLTSPQEISGAQVYDTVIGKAAAMILISCKVNFVYGSVMSKKAAEYLESNNTEYAYGKLVDYISNRAGDGMCPMEQTVEKIEDPHEGVDAILEFLKNMGDKSPVNRDLKKGV